MLKSGLLALSLVPRHRLTPMCSRRGPLHPKPGAVVLLRDTEVEREVMEKAVVNHTSPKTNDNY